MVKQKNKPWEERWETIRSIGGGGQGDTFLVKPKDSPTNDRPGVLKILKNQKDPERRKRMHREVAALSTLDCPGIPRLIESNSDQFAADVPLYMVAEFVEGKTLSEILEPTQPMGIADAVNLVLKLLETIQYCHNLGIVHRDIKPDNIIIRRDDINDPVVIDFGISFNESDAGNTILTPAWQQLGNRFLALPELQVNSSMQRDPRADIAQCCGILFFAIAGSPPVTLLDCEGRMPHQRPESQKALARQPDGWLAKINRIFDRAFEFQIDYRWQSIPELQQALIACISARDNARNAEQYIAQIQNKVSTSSDYARRQSFKELAQQLVKELYNVSRTVAGELGKGFGTIHDAEAINLKSRGIARVKIDWAKLRFSQSHGITNEFLPNNFSPKFTGTATGNELVLLAEVNGEKVELLRTPLNGEPDFTAFSEHLRLFYLEGVRKLIGA
ncbi:serine/threonine protein kinase (plasmid) [Oscillatoria nigro-viridis PCC 7112]|uniref:Serine/threonine protein kinase n=1 Tax=Phormidium nigroviride PCC 7112 TaxID=179408 RepID=K9VTJ5_9CYAN|nr:serine/threonine-protein kinase [Oscillatoria nigro-viridis]AFZ10812.1 serine/threonine protein kinase [Oscillatoria nigro-viridis PCC 7112]